MRSDGYRVEYAHGIRGQHEAGDSRRANTDQYESWRWPHFGRRTLRKIGKRCKTTSDISAGQAACAQVARRRDTHYGSAGWTLEGDVEVSGDQLAVRVSGSLASVPAGTGKGVTRHGRERTVREGPSGAAGCPGR